MYCAPSYAITNDENQAAVEVRQEATRNMNNCKQNDWQVWRGEQAIEQ